MSTLSAYNEKLVHTIGLLKLTYGLLFVIAGADKFFNLVTKWAQYVNPDILSYLGIDMQSLMAGVGIFEISIGALILFCCTRLGAYLSTLWLLIIVINLVTTGHYYDIAVRDLVMAVGAFTLGRLISLQEDLKR